MKNIYSYSFDELEDYLSKINEKKYRAKQIYQWLYVYKINNFDEMTNISKNSINNLKNNFTNHFIKIKNIKKHKDTTKYLLALQDNNLIEAVLMKHNYGISLCVSSQVGCNIGCSFCESGKLKKVRDLDVYEMVQQILLIEKNINKRIDSVVIMGIGEPFDNYDNVMNFIRIINNPFGLAIGARHITVSTSGLIPGIKKFADEGMQVNLALSLHAPNDILRSKIMKINDVYNIDDLINTIKEYIKKTNRRVTLEYVMLEYINDEKEQALELVNLIKGMNVYVNLIPYNETMNSVYKKSSKARILMFYNILKKHNINVTIRREFGLGIDAACGQLRAKKVNK